MGLKSFGHFEGLQCGWLGVPRGPELWVNTPDENTAIQLCMLEADVLRSQYCSPTNCNFSYSRHRVRMWLYAHSERLCWSENENGSSHGFNHTPRPQDAKALVSVLSLWVSREGMHVSFPESKGYHHDHDSVKSMLLKFC